MFVLLPLARWSRWCSPDVCMIVYNHCNIAISEMPRHGRVCYVLCDNHKLITTCNKCSSCSPARCSEGH